MLGVGIIGCGLIGQKRALQLGGGQLIACADLVAERAAKLASTVPGCLPCKHWSDLLSMAGVEVVILATTNDALAEIGCAALAAGKHILIEKPAARNVRELETVREAANRSGRLVRVGFNHRYHPAFRKARELFQSGALGPLMFIRGRYGHGGRLGYEKEWRADPVKSGGGEILDQGVHLIDLSRWFLGDFSRVEGHATTYFWKMPVDDNAFMNLRTAFGQTAFLHVSCTEWKNLFSFEIYGRDAKLHIEGLGGSYGVEKLAYYKMLPQMGPPETTIWEYPGTDNSWNLELSEFMDDIRLGRQPSAGLGDAHAVLQVVERIYQASNKEI